MSPYEKWMAAQEATASGNDISFVTNSTGHAEFDIRGKDGARLEKLHTKHGISRTKWGKQPAADNASSSFHNPMQDTSADRATLSYGARKSAVVSMDIYGGGDDDNFAATYDDEEIYGSTHNPMNDASMPRRATAVVDTSNVYDNEEEDDVFEEEMGERASEIQMQANPMTQL
jgi:hypothetical protein